MWKTYEDKYLYAKEVAIKLKSLLLDRSYKYFQLLQDYKKLQKEFEISVLLNKSLQTKINTIKSQRELSKLVDQYGLSIIPENICNLTKEVVSIKTELLSLRQEVEDYRLLKSSGNINTQMLDELRSLK